MARRSITERDATEPATEPDTETDRGPVADSVTEPSVDGDSDAEDDVRVELGSDLPPPVYEPVDRDEWMRHHREELEAQGLLGGVELEEEDPVFGPPHPDSTSELLRRPERPARPLRKPIVVTRRRKPRLRRVTRVVRHVDTWSVFKVALVFNVFLLVVALTSGVLLWQVARATGTIDNVERFFESFGWRTFKLNGGEIYHNAWIIGIFASIGLTGAAVLGATLFNLITDLVGGIRVTVLEEEVRTRDERVRPLETPEEAAPLTIPPSDDEVVLAEPEGEVALPDGDDDGDDETVLEFAGPLDLDMESLTPPDPETILPETILPETILTEPAEDPDSADAEVDAEVEVGPEGSADVVPPGTESDVEVPQSGR